MPREPIGKLTRRSTGRRLTPEEAAQARLARAEAEQEKPAVIARYRARKAAQELVSALRSARQDAELTLQEMQDRTGMDASNIVKLETGQRENPTLETLFRYADAVGKQLELRLVEKR
jgi:DNA-binding XRE family transcriptional regulator